MAVHDKEFHMNLFEKFILKFFLILFFVASTSSNFTEMQGCMGILHLYCHKIKTRTEILHVEHAYKIQKIILSSSDLRDIKPEDLSIFYRVEEIEITNSELSDGLFGRMDRLRYARIYATTLPPLNKLIKGRSLLNITITSSNIQRITADAFSDAPQLESISLIHNNIMYVDDNAFSNLTHLKLVNLSNNAITWQESARNWMGKLTERSVNLQLTNNPLCSTGRETIPSQMEAILESTCQRKATFQNDNVLPEEIHRHYYLAIQMNDTSIIWVMLAIIVLLVIVIVISIILMRLRPDSTNRNKDHRGSALYSIIETK